MISSSQFDMYSNITSFFRIAWYGLHIGAFGGGKKKKLCCFSPPPLPRWKQETQGRNRVSSVGLCMYVMSSGNLRRGEIICLLILSWRGGGGRGQSHSTPPSHTGDIGHATETLSQHRESPPHCPHCPHCHQWPSITDLYCPSEPSLPARFSIMHGKCNSNPVGQTRVSDRALWSWMRPAINFNPTPSLPPALFPLSVPFPASLCTYL